jgi:hypothetical protein
MLGHVGRPAALVFVSLIVACAFVPACASASDASWTIQSSATPGMESTGLLGVSCSSATACTGVGAYFYEEHSQPLAERLNGTQWTREAVPLPAEVTDGAFEAVSCQSASVCVAVGWYLNSTGESVTLAEQWNGSTWVVQPTPSPAEVASASLDGVSCSSATMCIAVGTSYDAQKNERAAIVERWNGTDWIASTAALAGVETLLSSVSCTSETSCFAVGSARAEVSSAERRKIVAEEWNGSSWSVAATISPGGWSSELSSISCTTASACTAVGYAWSGEAYPVPLAERWNGSAWSIQTVPVSAEYQGSRLYSVSCPSLTTCYGVGTHGSSESENQLGPLAEEWNGSEWSSVATTVPPEYQNVLAGVACSTETACATVGYADNTADSPKALKPLTSPGAPAAVPIAPAQVITGEALGLLLPTQAGALEQTGTELTGRLRDAGHAASWYFQYGETTSYGLATQTETMPADGEAQDVDARLTSGVYQNATYHFRLVAVIEGHTFYGEDHSFEGPPDAIRPVIISVPPAALAPPPPPSKPAAPPPVHHASKPACKVPRITGLSLARAKKRIKAAHCALGKVKRASQASHAKTLVVAGVSPKAGSSLPGGTRVAIRLGAARKR